MKDKRKDNGNLPFNILKGVIFIKDDNSGKFYIGRKDSESGKHKLHINKYIFLSLFFIVLLFVFGFLVWLIEVLPKPFDWVPLAAFAFFILYIITDGAISPFKILKWNRSKEEHKIEEESRYSFKSKFDELISFWGLLVVMPLTFIFIFMQDKYPNITSFALLGVAFYVAYLILRPEKKKA